MYDFGGKVALVTGSSSGIGEAIALQLASLGTKVTITGRVEHELHRVAHQIQQLTHEDNSTDHNCLVIVGDLVRDRTLPQQLVQRTLHKFGRLDILVNNAGGGDPEDKGFDEPNLLNAFDRVMDLNVRTVLHLTQLSVPHLEQTKGTVLNISSIQAIKPASAALDMLTRTSASLLAGKGIRVNSINPGPVKTHIARSVGRTVDHSAAHDRKVIDRQCALDRRAVPKDVADLAIFLLSDLAANITGSIVVNDSGVLVRPLLKG